MKAFLPFGNKFDICLEVRTQNGVVKKKKKKKSNAALFAVPSPILHHCSNFFVDLITLPDFFLQYI